jgi:superfamily I DNA and/or RNA helicase
VLETSNVIGLTTTGVAQKINTLQHIKCKVLICEEAAEIMEPHMLSALLPSVEHVIAIGDHQQLRPKIQNFSLSLESSQGSAYQLDRSQFERLTVEQSGRSPLPIAALSVQRRMRPEISNLIRTTIYPRLIDHEIIKDLPNVVGFRDNVFWLDHDYFEDSKDEDPNQKSKSNSWEVSMVKGMIKCTSSQYAF